MRIPLLRPGSLQEIRDEFDRAENGMRVLLSGLSRQQLSAHPARGGWSIAQCLVHLTVTTDAFLPPLAEVLASLPGGETRVYRLDAAGALLVWLMEPPYRMRTRTPPRFHPRDLRSADEIAEGFSASQDRVQDLMGRSEGKPLDRARIISPFNASVRYSAYSALRILAAHQRRHLWQATRVRAELPRASWS